MIDFQKIFHTAAEDFKLFSQECGDPLEPEMKEKMSGLGWNITDSYTYIDTETAPTGELMWWGEKTRNIWQKGQEFEGSKEWYRDLATCMNLDHQASFIRRWRLDA